MPSFMKKLIQFLKEAYSELKKVTWLSRKEAIASTVVVIILVSIVAVFIGFADLLLTKVLQAFL